MCFGDGPDPPPAPAAPPPPPPTLEQAAPELKSRTTGEETRDGASGAKKYRSSNLGISASGEAKGATSTGLGIT